MQSIFLCLSVSQCLLLPKEQREGAVFYQVNSTCNKQRVHPRRRLGWLEELGQVLFREWGFTSTLTLHVLLLAPLLILKFKKEGEKDLLSTSAKSH